MKLNFSRKAVLLTVISLTLLLTLGLLCACDGGSAPDETPAPTDAVTDTPTEAPADPVTEAPTDGETEAPTEAPTEEITEPAETMPEDKPTNSAVLTFCDTPLNATFLETNSAAEFSVVQDGEQGSVLKLTVADSKRINDPYIKIDYTAYMAACGLEPVAWNDCGVALVLMKVESATNTKVEMAAYNKSGEKSKTVRTEGSFKKSETGWQYVMLPLVTDAYDGTLTELRFDFLDKPRERRSTSSPLPS